MSKVSKVSIFWVDGHFGLGLANRGLRLVLVSKVSNYYIKALIVFLYVVYRSVVRNVKNAI